MSYAFSKTPTADYHHSKNVMSTQHSLAPIEATSIFPASPSISSSRRTSVDTQTRSSTVSSPALGPVSTTSGGLIGASTSADQLASARRNRAALRDFYGLKSPPTQKDAKDGKEQEGETEIQPGKLDSVGFDAKLYVKELLGKESLERLLKTEGSLVSGKLLSVQYDIELTLARD